VVNPFSDVSFSCTLRSDVITFSPIFPSFFVDVMATFMTHFSQLVLISKGPIHLFSWVGGSSYSLFPFIHGLLYDFMDVDMTCGFENFNALDRNLCIE